MTTTRRDRRTGGRERTSDLAPRTLGITLAVGAAVALLLWRISGPPQVPTSPDWPRIRDTLTGSELAEADIIVAATTIAWLVLAYLALTIGLRSIVVLADRVTGGARWARTGLSMTNLITLPAVRRLVDGGVGGTLLVTSWLPDPSRAVAAAELVPVVAHAAPLTQIERPGDVPSLRMHEEHEPRVVTYTVVRGDYLWDIARRFYDDGSRYTEIWEQNRDRAMTGGERFTDPRVIRPGWQLYVPLPAVNVSVDNGDLSYRVAQGDDLWGIAARLLGDGFRWMEIWELNRDQDMGGGRRFANANLILPGWQLRMPVDRIEPPAATSARPPAAAPAAPAATETPPPSPSVAPSAPMPTAAGPEATAPRDTDDSAWSWPSLPPAVTVTAAGFVVIGGAVLFVHRLRQRALLAIRGRQAARTASYGDAGRVALASEAVASALIDHGFGDAGIALVGERTNRLRFAIEGLPDGSAALDVLRDDLARRLACRVDLESREPGTADLTLIDLRRLAASLALPSPARGTLIVPAGAHEQEIVYVNLAAGGVAIDGSASERRQLIKSWVASLVATHEPGDLSLRADAQTASMLGDLSGAPHFAGLPAAQDVAALTEELDAVGQSRLTGSAARTPIVAMVDCAGAIGGPLAAVLRDGPAVGVHVIGEGMPRDAGAFDTTLAFASDAASPEADKDGIVDSPHLVLRRRGKDDLRLEPVLVRRDDSPRWQTSAELSAALTEAAPVADPTPWTGRDVPASQVPPGVEPLDPDAFARSDDRAAMTTDVTSAEPVTNQPVNHTDSVALLSHPREEERAEAVDDESAEDRESAEVMDTPIPLAPGEAPARPDMEQPAPNAPTDTERAHAISLVAVPAPTLAPPPATEEQGVRQPSLFAGVVDAPGDEDEADSAPRLTVRCFGRFEVAVDGSRIDRWNHLKSPELLAFLIVRGSALVSRETVSAALWPDIPWDKSAEHMLSNVATQLRATCRAATGRDDLQLVDTARRGGYQLRPHLFDVDLDAFEAGLRRAAGLPGAEALDEYDRALALYRGDFLEDEFVAWAETYRADYRNRLLDGARRALDLALVCDEEARAVTYARSILTYDPTDEATARTLMRVLAAAGDINGARKVYKVLAEALQDELDDAGARPAPETRALLTELLEETQSA